MSRSRERPRPARWCGPINDKVVAEGQAAADGSWRLVPAKPVEPGKYKLRLDRLAKDGKPVARLELPFERIPMPPATGNSERLVVVRGDSLWNIARAHYGDGFRHTLIYGANKDQIRDPDLIYPGQVFSLPQVNWVGMRSSEELSAWSQVTALPV